MTYCTRVVLECNKFRQQKIVIKKKQHTSHPHIRRKCWSSSKGRVWILRTYQLDDTTVTFVQRTKGMTLSILTFPSTVANVFM